MKGKNSLATDVIFGTLTSRKYSTSCFNEPKKLCYPYFSVEVCQISEKIFIRRIIVKMIDAFKEESDEGDFNLRQ